jgi:hypothetical protein
MRDSSANSSMRQTFARSIVEVSRHPEDVEQAVYLAHRWSEERRGLISRTTKLLSGAVRRQ